MDEVVAEDEEMIGEMIEEEEEEEEAVEGVEEIEEEAEVDLGKMMMMDLIVIIMKIIIMTHGEIMEEIQIILITMIIGEVIREIMRMKIDKSLWITGKRKEIFINECLFLLVFF